MTHYAVLNFCSEDNEYIEIQAGICIFHFFFFRNLYFSNSFFFCIFNLNPDAQGKKVWESVILDSVLSCPLHPYPTPNQSLSFIGSAS